MSARTVETLDCSAWYFALADKLAPYMVTFGAAVALVAIVNLYKSF